MENNQEIKVGIDIPRINYIKHHYLYPTVRVISNLSNDTVKEVLMNVYKTMETLDRTRDLKINFSSYAAIEEMKEKCITEKELSMVNVINAIALNPKYCLLFKDAAKEIFEKKIDYMKNLLEIYWLHSGLALEECINKHEKPSEVINND